MAGDIEDISTEIKDRYPTGIWKDMTEKEAKYRAALKRSNLKTDSGGSFKWPFRLASQWNVGASNDGEDLPTAYDPQRVVASMQPVLFTGAIQVGLKSKYALTDKQSVWSDGILNDRIEGTAEDLAKYINMVYAGSVVGRLATVASDGSSNFVADKPQGITLLRERMVLEARDALSSGSVRDSFSAHRITALDEDTRTVTYVKASDGTTDDRTLVAGDHIFISGTYAELANVFSLRHIVDNANDSPTNVYNQSRTTYPKLKAQIFGNSGVLRNLDEQLLLRAIDAPPRRVGKRITRALANSGQGRKYVEFAAADRRYPGSTKGAQSYSVGYGDDSLQIVAPGVNCTLELERDVHPRTIYLLAQDTFFLQQQRDLDWIDENGLLQLTPGTNKYKGGFLGYMCAVENQGNTMPGANARIDDLVDDLVGDTI